MGDEMGRATAFKLHLRCSNCRKDSTCLLTPPCGPDSPTDIDELLESGWLQQQRFACSQCESIIATITAVTMPKAQAA